MKINQYLINNFKVDENNFLNKNTIFKGKIIDIFGSKVLIETKGRNVLPATLDSDVTVNIGDELTFLVKSSSKNEILIKAMNKEELEQLSTTNKNDSDSSILKLLKNMNIEENKTSLDMVKNLIKGNVALSRENINNSIKILDKVIQLDSIAEDERVIILNEVRSEKMLKDYNVSKDEIRNNENNSNIQADKKTLITLDTNKEELNAKVFNKDTFNARITNKAIEFKSNDVKMGSEIDINNSHINKVLSLKSDIKNLIVIKENIDFKEKDITIDIKDILAENSSINLKDGLAKLITFFIKNDIKPNLNNIINMQELNQTPEKFIEKRNNLQNVLKTKLGENTFKDLFITEETSDQDGLKEIKGTIFEIQDIIDKIKSHGKFNIDKEVIELKNKNDFLTDINKNLLFTLIPITHKKYDLNGVMNFIKKNNKKSNKDNTNVFINLNTHSIGNIKISCNFTGYNLGIKMGMEKKHLDLFQKNEEILIQKIINLGYKVKTINYVFEDEIDIIDTINGSPKSSSTYYLDVKV